MRRMRARTMIVAVLVAAMSVACSGSDAGGTVRVVVTHEGERMVVIAEVAATQTERQVGLMNRAEVPEGTGMLFMFPRPTRGGFWMKNTLIGLHILFIRGGRVVEIRNMQPCTADPCPLTTPAEDYDQALEVPLGTLGGIQEGARVETFGSIPSPS